MQAGGPSTACPTLAPSSSATCRMVRDRFIDACFFLLVSYRPLAIGRIVIAARVVAAECSTAHAEEPQRSTTATKNVQLAPETLS